MQLLALTLTYFLMHEKDKFELYLEADESILNCSTSATNKEDLQQMVPRSIKYTLALSIGLYLITQINHVSSSRILIDLSDTRKRQNILCLVMLMVTVGFYTMTPFFMSLKLLFDELDSAVNFCEKDERKDVLTNEIRYIKTSSFLYLSSLLVLALETLILKTCCKPSEAIQEQETEEEEKEDNA